MRVIAYSHGKSSWGGHGTKRPSLALLHRAIGRPGSMHSGVCPAGSSGGEYASRERAPTCPAGCVRQSIGELRSFTFQRVTPTFCKSAICEHSRPMMARRANSLISLRIVTIRQASTIGSFKKVDPRLQVLPIYQGGNVESYGLTEAGRAPHCHRLGSGGRQGCVWSRPVLGLGIHARFRVAVVAGPRPGSRAWRELCASPPRVATWPCSRVGCESAGRKPWCR